MTINPVREPSGTRRGGTEVALGPADAPERAPTLRLPSGTALPSWAARALGAAAALALVGGLVGLLAVDDGGPTARTSTEQAADLGDTDTGLDRLSPLPGQATEPGSVPSAAQDDPAEVGGSSSALDELILEPFDVPSGLGVPDAGDQDYRRYLPGRATASAPTAPAASTPIAPPPAPGPATTPAQPAAPTGPVAPTPAAGSPTISLGALGGLTLEQDCVGILLLGTNVGCDPATGDAGLSLLGIPLIP